MGTTPPSSPAPAARPSPGTRIAIVVARWNEAVTRRLLEGALVGLAAGGVDGDHVDVAWVPGSFELPLVADRAAATGRYAAVLCLGAIIRGETDHDRHIAGAVARGIEQAARERGLPILFGVLTCADERQALARAVVPPAGGDNWRDNKGAECAAAALEMISILARVGPAARS
jgi:6,7-dimethyl-8-ribityllumazine synthase